ncbi:MAG: hypothetical protein HUJ16_11300 [Kangiella sp.]|nr:hypothetical protein [Kangiella sp.]
MAKHIDENDVRKIKEILDGWEGKLTWNLLVDEFETRVHRKTTRQALSRNNEIKIAFNDKKMYLNSGLSIKSKPQTLKSAAQTIDRIKAENIRLIKENERLLEKFIIWQYNAHKRGITEEQLNEPLPAIDRRS